MSGSDGPRFKLGVPPAYPPKDELDAEEASERMRMEIKDFLFFAKFNDPDRILDALGQIISQGEDNDD